MIKFYFVLFFSILEKCSKRERHALDEYEVYEFLDVIGIHTPPRVFVPADTPLEKVEELLPKGCEKFVAKVVVEGLTHKTEAKGVIFNVTPQTAKDAISDFTSRFPKEKYIGTLFVQMLPLKGGLGDEILISLFQDPDFGPMVALGFGGTLVEELKEQMKPNRASVFLPANLDLDANKILLEKLPLIRIITGAARGSKKVMELNDLMTILKNLQWAAQYFSIYNPKSRFTLEEMEINPATVHEGKLIALDGVLRCKFSRRCNPDGTIINQDATSETPLLSLPLSLNPKPLNKITNMLRPRSVAIAGASSKNKNGTGTIITRKIHRSGYITNDNIYVLNPTASEIEGCKCYKSLQLVLDARGGVPVDLLVVSVPAKGARQLCEDCFALHGAESILIITAGFAETEGGSHIQHEMEAALNKLNLDQKKRPVIVGPNTLGFSSKGSIDTLFTPQYKSSRGVIDLLNERQKMLGEKDKEPLFTGKSNVAFISQSGANLISRISDLAGILDPVLNMSVGNQMDLSVTDFLEFLLTDIAEGRKKREENKEEKIEHYADVSVIGLYIEGFNEGEGRRMMQLCRKARDELGVAVVVYKSGRSKQGKDAAKGHTASMAGDYDMFSYLLRISGAIVCDTFEEFDQILMVISLMPSFTKLKTIKKEGESSSYENNQVAVGMISNAGYEKCAMADHLFTGNPKCITLPHWTEETSKKIDEFFTRCGLKGVVDISSVLDVTPMLTEAQWAELCEIMLMDDNCNCCVLSAVPESVQYKVLPKYIPPTSSSSSYDPANDPLAHAEDVLGPGNFLDRMVELKEKYGKDKPFVISLESGRLFDFVCSKLIEHGIPVFRRADEAARCVSKIITAMRGEVV